MTKYITLFLLMVCHFCMASQPVILLFGSPGAGKGTFSQHLKVHYGFAHISPGDLIREQIRQRTPLGLEVEEVVKRGNFIDKEIIHRLITDQVKKYKGQDKPFIIDGFGRTQEDQLFLCHLLKEFNLIDQVHAIYFEADMEICIQRMMNRVVCPQCGYIFNLKFSPPCSENTCDLCSSELEKRINDSVEVILKRLVEYHETIASIYRVGQNYYPFMNYDANQALDIAIEDFSAIAKDLLVDKVY